MDVRVAAWLDEQTWVRVLPDRGGWAVVLTRCAFRSAGLPPVARLRVVAEGGVEWEPDGLGRVIGEPARSPDGRSLAGWALAGEGVGSLEARLWVMSPDGAGGQVRFLHTVPVGWLDTGSVPLTVGWAGADALLAGTPRQATGAELAALAEAQVFEDAPGRRVRIDVEDAVRPVALSLISVDGRGGRQELALAPPGLRQMKVSHDARHLAVVHPSGARGEGVVTVAGLPSGEVVAEMREPGLAAIGWLADGRLVGVRPGGAASAGWTLKTVWATDGRREVICEGLSPSIVAALRAGEPPWWSPWPAGGLMMVDASGGATHWTFSDAGRPGLSTDVIDPRDSRLVVVRGGRALSVLAAPGRREGDRPRGTELEVLHRTRIGPGRTLVRVDAEDGTVWTVDQRGRLSASAGAAPRRRSDRVRMVDLGDPVGDGSVRVCVHLPARPVRGCVVVISPLFGGGQPAEANSPRPGEPRPLAAADPLVVLVRTGFAVAVVATAVPWWPSVSDELIRPSVAERVAKAVTSTGLGDHVDLGRLAVAGHSFGATLALIALADTGLFTTAMVTSGGYCRSLTPLGFQDEYRTLWEAAAVYRDFDAVASASRIQRPVLIMHGLADRHPATPPEQAQLLYQALIGLGTSARLVLIPGEGHQLVTREGITVSITEQVRWLERWLR